MTVCYNGLLLIMKKEADIIIKNGMVLTLDGNLNLHEKADVTIIGPKLVEIAPSTSYTAAKIIDAQGKLVMPGLINTHTHAAMVMMRGLADDMPLDIWWQKFIFPIEQKLLDPDFIRIGVSLAAVEMIRSGTTAFSDMYFFEDRAAEVCQEIGIRAFLGEGILDFPSPGHPNAEHALASVRQLYDKWKGHPTIHLMVAPHAPYTCGQENLLKAKRLADELGLPLHIHLSETAGEVAEFKKQHGLSPVEFLDKIGFLSDKVIAVHCVHLSQNDIQILAARQVKVAHCQESNMKLASGTAPVVEMLDYGITVGLGTDGAASNNNLDMFDEMDSVAKVHKLIKNDPTVMDARTVLRMATAEGAKVVQKPEIGSLEVGKVADLIIVDLQVPHLVPLFNIYSQLVYSAGGSEVRTVIVNGKLVMEDRQILTVDEADIIKQAGGYVSKIKTLI